MKKKLISFLSAFVFCTAVSAQASTETTYSLSNSADRASMSIIRLLDPYLSPSIYSGVGVGYEHSASRLFNTDNEHLSWQSALSGMAGFGLNPAVTAQMSYLGADYTWGMHYHISPVDNLQILLGGSVDVDFALKTLSRNVNNPVNVDLASNINFSAKVAYDIRLRRRTLRLKYSFETPFWGIMFVPMGGASYFEMFELGNLSNAVHFSSLHNKQGYDSALRIDIPFRHSSWQFGISSNVLTYKANGMVFNRSISSIEIAWVYDLYIFRGMKDKAPNNFIKPNF